MVDRNHPSLASEKLLMKFGNHPSVSETLKKREQSISEHTLKKDNSQRSFGILRKGNEKTPRSDKLERKVFLNDPKRNIVANIGKNGIIVKQPYLIYDQGCDITPKVLEDPSFPPTQQTINENIKDSNPFFSSKMQMLGKSVIDSWKSSLSALTEPKFEPRAPSFKWDRSYSVISKMTHTQSLLAFSDIVSLDSFIIINQPNFAAECGYDDELSRYSENELESGSEAPSMFRLREDPPPEHPELKKEFTVNLTETSTMFLLQIPSTAESLDSEEGKLISESNSTYEKNVEKTKSVSEVAIQTAMVSNKNRKLDIPRSQRKNASTFVASWEMYDTYEALANKASKVSIESREVGQVATVEKYVDKAQYNISFNYLGSDFNDRLLVALMVMERVIISGTSLYKEPHLTFKGQLVQDPLSLDVVYNYSLKHMWTFHNESIIKKRVVTSISWNESNANILAVGYGKFYYKDKRSGLVCIWNVKNPLHPERHYDFEHPVTFVSFNPTKKQILAVAFYDGSVILIDIISWVLLIKATNHHYPLYYPVWQAQWFSDGKGTDNILITSGKNGKIYRYKKDKFFTSRKIMTIGKIHGRIQGVEQPKPCHAKKTLTLKSPSVEVLIPHPCDPLMYVVGTSDGCVYVCSILHRYDYLWLIQAHSGPVYNIQFNPFCNMVFLTCGMDWCIRIWAEGVTVPLMTLHSGMLAVEDAIWSPLHSTVILSLTGKQIEIWDIRRSTSKPKSSLTSPSASFNTKIRFTPDGHCISVGDLDGNVHVLAMMEMPFSPMYQEDTLVQTLKLALSSKQDLLGKLEKLGSPFGTVSKAENFLNKMNRRLQKLHQSADPKPKTKIEL